MKSLAHRLLHCSQDPDDRICMFKNGKLCEASLSTINAIGDGSVNGRKARIDELFLAATSARSVLSIPVSWRGSDGQRYQVYARAQSSAELLVRLVPLKPLHQYFGPLLTKSEQRIMNYLKCELSNKKIAKALFVSAYTVRTHIRNIYKIIRVRNRISAINEVAKIGHGFGRRGEDES